MFSRRANVVKRLAVCFRSTAAGAEVASLDFKACSSSPQMLSLWFFVCIQTRASLKGIEIIIGE